MNDRRAAQLAGIAGEADKGRDMARGDEEIEFAPGSKSDAFYLWHCQNALYLIAEALAVSALPEERTEIRVDRRRLGSRNNSPNCWRNWRSSASRAEMSFGRFWIDGARLTKVRAPRIPPNARLPEVGTTTTPQNNRRLSYGKTSTQESTADSGVPST